MDIELVERAATDTEAAGPGRRRYPHVALWILVVLPVGLAVAEAIRSPRLNFNDFWYVLGNATTPTGALVPAQLFHLYDGQPAVLPTLVFWLDAKLFGGANWVLGLFSVVLAIVLLAALWSMLPARLTGARRVAVLAALSALVFSSAATEYFGIGMMGTWWLLGMSGTAIALTLAHRGATVPAVVVGLLACLSHGDALPVWAGLALIAWLRRDRLWRALLPIGVGAGVGAAWLLAPQPPSYPPPAILGADSYLSTGLKSLGQIWSADSTDLAILAGAVTGAVLATMLAGAARRRWAGPSAAPDPDFLAEDAGWLGVAVHILLVAVILGISRGRLGNTETLAPRYAAVAILGTAAVLVLVAVRGPGQLRTRIVPIALLIGIASYGVGTSWATVTRNRYPTQPALAVAMRIDADGVITSLLAYPRYLPVLRAMHVYPFTPDFTLGCHGPELGSHVDLAAARPLSPPGSGPTSGTVESASTDGDTEITGWAMVHGQTPDCVLVTDQRGTVVGGGAIGIPRPDVVQIESGTGRAGWLAVARPGTTNNVVLVMSGGVTYRIVAALHKG